MVPNSIVQEFMKCLQAAENSRDAKELSRLFSDDAQLFNLTRPLMNSSSPSSTMAKSSMAKAQNSYQTNAHGFWRQYLLAFDYVNSHFTHVFDNGQTAVLEWHSTGRLTNSLPIEYNGVSILEYNGKQITQFRTYYDSAAFLSHVTYGKPYSETVGIPDITNEATS